MFVTIGMIIDRVFYDESTAQFQGDNCSNNEIVGSSLDMVFYNESPQHSLKVLIVATTRLRVQVMSSIRTKGCKAKEVF